MPSSNRKRSHGRGNARGSSAAAFAGVIGLPDPGRGPTYADGGMRAFCSLFNRTFDEIAETRRPEYRAFSRTERTFRIL